jgi:hypothetical protein
MVARGIRQDDRGRLYAEAILNDSINATPVTGNVTVNSSMRRSNMKLLVGVLVLAVSLLLGIGVAGAQQSNPQHSIDLSTATTNVNNITNAGAVTPSTGTVQGSTSTIHITTPPPGSIPGSGGRPRNAPPPPPPKK